MEISGMLSFFLHLGQAKVIEDKISIKNINFISANLSVWLGTERNQRTGKYCRSYV